MPKLRKLEMQGFKSFANPTSFLYPTGITAIVGPNGSGKSNVADAIRWVLGEQRMTSIRGRTGDDMIFAGSSRRTRSGMARATITFDNQDNWVPVDFAEVTIERRTYRNGTSDYLLNGSKVRLMDLRDLLDRAGLGRDAYLVIGQGLVDQILSLRPRERLALFEQAAGITPYRTRREDSVRRLDETKANLQRVYDIVGEIEPRLRRLERQATRAEEYARLEHELEETLRVWYGYRWDSSLNAFDQARQRVRYRHRRASALLEGVETLDTKVAAERSTIATLRDRLSNLHRESGARHDEAASRQQELAVARERQRQLVERLDENRANMAPLQTAMAAEADDIAELTAELTDATERLQQAQLELEQAKANQASLARRRTELLRRKAGLESKGLEIRHRLADRESRVEQLSARLAELEQQLTELAAARDQALARRREQQRAVETARQDVETQEAALAAAQHAADQTAHVLKEAEDGADALRDRSTGLEATLAHVSARWSALERLAAERTGMLGAVKAVMQAHDQGELQGIHGPVSSLVEVPQVLETAVETALGDRLQYLVVDTPGDAWAAIRWLQEHRAGSATFLPLDTAEQRIRTPSSLVIQEQPDVWGVASDFVGCDTGVRSSMILLLGRTVIVRSLDAARRLLQELAPRCDSGFHIVTVDGEVLASDGAVTGGGPQAADEPGLLSRERERRELHNQVQRMRAQVDQARTDLGGRQAKVAELARADAEARDKLQQALGRMQTRNEALAEAGGRLTRALQEHNWYQTRLIELEAAREDARTVHERLRAEVAKIKDALKALGSHQQRLDAQLSELVDEAGARMVAERQTTAEIRCAVLGQECDDRRVLLDARTEALRRLRRQAQSHEQRAESLRAELNLLRASLRNLETTYEASRAEALALASQVGPLESQLADREASLQQLEQGQTQARRALREAEQRLSQAEVETGRREDQIQSLRREIEETLGIVIGNLPDTISSQQPLPLDDIVSQLPTVTELPEGLDTQIRDLRTQIRRLGPINTAAKEEFAELSQRHGFLREQMVDLEHASAHLREVIRELDEMMDTMFSTTFSSIASEFARGFEVLFSGGSARLDLVEEEDGRAGVEIYARPPGKRTTGLDVLSGGERCLTAVALIFAVMRISPTPFCVLDEVDAMLDEANVGRFRRMLAQLARETQFVIITHNRGTVEVADTIYGVSMGEDGVSSVLSLNLEDLPVSEMA